MAEADISAPRAAAPGACRNGHQVSGGQRFCGDCGVPVANPGAAPVVAATRSAEWLTWFSLDPTVPRRRLAVAVAAAVAFAAVLAVVVWVATRSPAVSNQDAIANCQEALTRAGLPDLTPGTAFAARITLRSGQPAWDVNGQWTDPSSGSWEPYECTVAMSGRVTMVSTPFGEQTY